MSDENIKGIPEEEAVELTEETVEEAVEETVAETAEEIPEEASEESAEETAEEISEEASEETNEEISEDLICPYCGENKKEEDSDYCAECEAAMLARKIPFLAWVGGLAAVVFSVFALALVFLLTAPSLQVAKGDSYAREKRWYSAYTAYSKS